MTDVYLIQAATSCATAAGAGPLTLAGALACSLLSQNQFCRNLRIFGVPFSAIHSDDLLFHDY